MVRNNSLRRLKHKIFPRNKFRGLRLKDETTFPLIQISHVNDKLLVRKFRFFLRS